jgi:Outer membrane protein beta-barrel domain
MIKKIIFILFICLHFDALAQNTTTVVVDSLYREDQFYASISINLLQNKPSGFAQRGISPGITFGFLRDMPINKARTWAIGAGAGYSYNNLVQNIKIIENPNGFTYNTEPTYESNSLDLHYIDFPIELRWRTSTPTNTNFYRIHTGFKASYLFTSLSEYISNNENSKISNNGSLSKWIFGPYVSFGNGTLNFYAYYALTPIAKQQVIAGDNLKLKAFNLGFQFYIL